MRISFLPIVLVFFALLVQALVHGQTCTTQGQNPSTAFPVCGTSVFKQATVPLCGGRRVLNPSCTAVLDDRNPFWYKFTCFSTGTLGFLITPNNNNSDYDWQIWDITNRNPDDVYNNAAWVISCNWSGESGPTGTSTGGTRPFVCDGFGQPLISSMPVLTQGNTYLMLISHFSATQAGYQLAFGGGTASITDSTPGKFLSLKAGCGGTTLRVKLNKKIKCSSIAPNGSDFLLTPANGIITAAQGIGCGTGFDTDSVLITVDRNLSPGPYNVQINNGSDGNSLLDYCDNNMALSENISVMVLPALPTNLDSIKPVGCKPNTLELTMKDPIQCGSIAADGSDFVLTGPAAPAIIGASGICVNGLTNTITLQLAGTIGVGGQYKVAIKNGSDGNTLLNECALQTVVGSFKNVVAYDSVKANIAYTLSSDCILNKFVFFNRSTFGVNSWLWQLPNGTNSRQQTYAQSYRNADTVRATLTVSNGVCTDKASIQLNPGAPHGKAIFTLPNYACPLDSVLLTDSSTGPILTRAWRWGNAINLGTAQRPRLQFALTEINTTYKITLVVTDTFGCADSLSRTIIVPGNCYIAVPTGFTPNGDGLNDYLYPINAFKAQNLQFKIFNRYGKMVWETTDWTRKWDGKINGNPQGSGVYVWVLTYYDPELKKDIFLKGTSTLIR